MMTIDLNTHREASRNFGACDITRVYLADALLSPEAKARIRELQSEYFKVKGLER